MPGKKRMQDAGYRIVDAGCWIGGREKYNIYY
jgi:hypothetical protein